MRIIILVALTVIPCLCASNLKNTYQNCHPIQSGSTQINVSWTIVNGDSVMMGIESNLQGYVALGISPSGDMYGADMWFVSDSTTSGDQCYGGCFIDAYSNSEDQPTHDPSQDWKNTVITKANGLLTGEATRLLNTGDSNDMVITPGKITPMIWAVSDQAAAGTSATLQYHGDNYGTFSIDFGANSTCDSSSPSSGTEYTSSAGDFDVKWNISADGKSISFNYYGKTAGWISIGFNTKPLMAQNADLYVGWVVNGQVTLFDTYAPTEAIPVVDSQDDVKNASGSESNGITYLSFSRLLDTGDPNDCKIVDEPLYLLYAYATADGTSQTNYPQHITTGIVQVNFFSKNGILGNVNVSNSPSFNAGHILLVILSSIAFIWTFIRYLKKYCKYKKYHDIENPPPSKTTNSFVSRAQGVFQTRVPVLEWEVLDFFIIILYIGINFFCIFAAYFPNPSNVLTYYNFGKSIGDLLGATSVLIVIPATRNSLLLFLLGIPFDRAIKLHRMLGYWLSFLLLSHFIAMLVYLNQGTTALAAATAAFSGTNVWGLGGFFCIVVVVALSVEPLRRRYFNIFMASHYLFFGFFAFGYLHSPVFLTFFILAVIFYGIDIIIRFLMGTIPRKTTLLEAKPGSITRVRFPKNSLITKLKGYRVGQYVFLNFPGLNFFEWHPFSITSAPKDEVIEVNIRSLGNYTVALNELAAEKQRLWVRVEGPYGNLNLNYKRFPVLLLVAGGIGITPIMSIIRDIYQRKKKRALHTVHLIWSVPQEECYGWFSEDFQNIIESNTEQDPHLDLRVHVTKAEGELQSPLYGGRPNMKEIFGEIITESPNESCFVFVCGPRLMVEDVWDKTNKMKRKGKSFVFHQEIFDF